ncbi:MAG: DoxX family protein [Opitutales bacterium]|nr:DoxX family protein [Opitutales bacterium]
MEILAIALQVIVSLGLLNVWILRFNCKTSYRGGEATSMREEFAAYGLPASVMLAVGGLKILSALALLAGIWLPVAVIPAASVIALLMIAAIAMHMKVKDPLVKFLPAAGVLVMTIGILVLNA